MRLTKKSKILLATAAVVLLVASATIMPTRFSSAEAATTCARGAIVVDGDTGRVFYEKNADEKLPIASTTKILTAITVIESCEDIEAQVTVPDAAVGVEGSSIYLEKGEKLRVIDLLYGLMLQSGNDCAVALAHLTAGDVPRFARLMNVVADRAGAVNSHFANPHGLHDGAHYSTARDMAAIAAYAMRNETFRKIVSTENYYDCPFSDRGYNRVIHNKNKMLTMIEGGNGIKTGYTKAAGRCLVSSARRDDIEIICVVLDCGPMFEESCALINAAFQECGK